MDLKVEGAGQLVRQLSKFNTDVYKIMQAEIKDSMSGAASQIKQEMPTDNALSNWGSWADGKTRRSAFTVGAVSVGAFEGRDLGFNPAKVRRSIKFGVKQARLRRVGVVGVRGWAGTTDPGASIFTTAGSEARRPSTNSVFVRNMRRKHGTVYPRVLVKVWVDSKTRIGSEIDAALNRARIKVGL